MDAKGHKKIIFQDIHHAEHKGEEIQGELVHQGGKGRGNESGERVVIG